MAVGGNTAGDGTQDSDGIKYVGDEKNFDEAIEYLSQDPNMAKNIDDLSAEGTLVVIENRSGVRSNYYDPSTHEIHWDPGFSIQLADGTGMSPALILGHELAHANSGFLSRYIRVNIPMGKYSNLEEYRVIKYHEHPAAKTLREGIRNWHKVQPGTSFKRTRSVTEH